METVQIDFSESNFIDGSLVIPRIVEQPGKEYVAWGDKGKNNTYPDKLISLINNSALHNAICVNKAIQVAGNGFSFPEDQPNSEKTAEFLKKINEEGEDSNEVLSKVAIDYVVFGGFSLLITWAKDWKSIASIEHMAFDKIRSGKVNQYGKIQGYFYSYDWSNYRPNKTYIPVFNSNQENNKKAYQQALKEFNEGEKDSTIPDILRGKNNTQILVHKPYRPDSFYYPIPSYAGAITSIEADIESDTYALNSLKNGMDPGYVVTIFKKLDPKSRMEAANAFFKSYTSSKNAGKPILNFAETHEDASKIDVLASPNVDQRYVKINENSLQKILSGHRVTHPTLVGIMTAGKLGGSSDIKEAQQLFYSTVIQPDQHAIAKAFNKLMEINGLETLSIITNNPFELEEENSYEDGKELGNNNEVDTLDTEPAPTLEEGDTNE